MYGVHGPNIFKMKPDVPNNIVQGLQTASHGNSASTDLFTALKGDTCEATVYPGGIFGRISRYYAPRDFTTFTAQSPSPHLLSNRWASIDCSSTLSIFLSDPTSEYPNSGKHSETGSGVARYISSRNVFILPRKFAERPSKFLFQIARGSGATLNECTFLQKCKPLGSSQKEHFRVSLREVLGSTLFLLGKTWRNKRRLPSSTMNRSGACQYRTHRVPYQVNFYMWAQAWPTV